MPNTNTHIRTPRAETTARTFLRRLRGERPAIAGRRAAAQAEVHFHNGPQGQPAVCDNPRCASPRLEL